MLFDERMTHSSSKRVKSHMLKFIMKYFSEKLTLSARYLHYLIFILVLAQILISNFMKITDDGQIGNGTGAYYATWIHIGIGLSLLGLAITFTIVELRKHGSPYFYPYLFRDFSQLKSDLYKLRILELPETSPGGLAAIIQGLGLGALLLVTSSGAIWLLLWSFNSALATDAKGIHQLLTGLIEAYVIGHGGIGLLHMVIAYRKQKSANN